MLRVEGNESTLAVNSLLWFLISLEFITHPQTDPEKTFISSSNEFHTCMTCCIIPQEHTCQI